MPEGRCREYHLLGVEGCRHRFVRIGYFLAVQGKGRVFGGRSLIHGSKGVEVVDGSIGHGDLSEVVSVENSACGQVVKLASARAVRGLGADCPWFHGVVTGARCDFILSTELQVTVCSSVGDAIVEY